MQAFFATFNFIMSFLYNMLYSPRQKFFNFAMAFFGEMCYNSFIWNGNYLKLCRYAVNAQLIGANLSEERFFPEPLSKDF